MLKYLREGFGLTAADARADNNRALWLAAANGHVEMLKYLREGFGLTAVDAKGCRALWIAKWYKHNGAVQELRDNWK